MKERKRKEKLERSCCSHLAQALNAELLAQDHIHTSLKNHSYVPVNSKTAHASPGKPRAFDFFEKFSSNSPLCCQFRRSNAPPVRASKRVKSPTLQACEANCGNKFCKFFSHYEFLVQLVFAPHFKQRHIPR